MKIAIEGNIGSGKSSLMAAAKSISETCRESADFFFEPLETWHDLLQKYFEDPHAWALPFTLEVLRTHDRVLEWETSSKRKPHCIVERSPHACRDVFSHILKQDGVFSADDMRLIETYVDLFGWTPDVIIIVDVPPHECLERVHKRGRPNEQPTYEYLKCVQYYYDKMLHTTLQGVPVYRMIQSSSESTEAFQARFALLLERLIREMSRERGPPTGGSAR